MSRFTLPKRVKELELQLSHTIQEKQSKEKEIVSLKSELSEFKGTDKKYTSKDIEKAVELHKQYFEEFKGESENTIADYKSQVELLESKLSSTQEVLIEYTKALQILCDEMGVKDIALLIINNLKTFAQFKTDFVETTKAKLEIAVELDKQKYMTHQTEKNHDFATSIVSGVVRRGLTSQPNSNVLDA